MRRNYYLYVLSSRSRVLYVGVTNDLRQRLRLHRRGMGSEFTRRYRVRHLVHVERFARIGDAIQREKQLKSWRRSRKVELVSEGNPEWRDLSRDLGSPGFGARHR